MTRFARARGSKASNERVPEEATSWSVMKQQLQESKRENQEEKNDNNASSFNKTELFYRCKVNPVNSKVWEVFETTFDDDSASTKNKKSSLDVNKNVTNIMKKGTNKIKSKLLNDDKFDFSVSNDSLPKKCLTKDNNLIAFSKSKLSEKNDAYSNLMNVKYDFKRKRLAENLIINFTDSFTESRNEVPLSKSCIQEASVYKPIDDSSLVKNSSSNSINTNFHEENTAETTLKHKKKRKNMIMVDSRIDANVEKNTDDPDMEIKHKKSKFSLHNSNMIDQDSSLKKFHSNIKRTTIKTDKFNKDPPQTINVGSKMIEISHFQGFSVKKEDADRLWKLKKNLISKNLPRKEIENALRLERRRAEKALTREKKVVCFKCRQFGHNMAECPECEDPNGICFKCGSTEHSVHECKVVKNESFKFAHCFICQEQGHIARQCPDNPRGLYPKGGACKICGDVTHLRKDCPQLINEKEKGTITVGTVKNNSIEDLDEGLTGGVKINKVSKKKTSFVKF